MTSKKPGKQSAGMEQLKKLLAVRRAEAVKKKEERFFGKVDWGFNEENSLGGIAALQSTLEYPRQFAALSEGDMRRLWGKIIPSDAVLLALKPKRLPCSWLENGELVSRVWIFTTRDLLAHVLAGSDRWSKQMVVVTEHSISTIGKINTVWNRVSEANVTSAKRANINEVDTRGKLTVSMLYDRLAAIAAEVAEEEEEKGARDLGSVDTQDEDEDEDQEYKGVEEEEEEEETSISSQGHKRAAEAGPVIGAKEKGKMRATAAAGASGSADRTGSSRLLEVQLAMTSGMHASMRDAYGRAKRGADMDVETNRLYAESLELQYVSARNTLEIANMTQSEACMSSASAAVQAVSAEYARFMDECGATGAGDYEWNASVAMGSRVHGT
jgi:hypothetical protein